MVPDQSPPEGDRWRVRRAGPGDVAAVRAVSAEAYAASFQPVFGYLPAPALEDYAPRVAAGEVWLIEVGATGRPVGVAVLEQHVDHLLVYSIAVLPECWHAGIGRRLLALAEQRARGAGCPEVRLFTNTRMTRNLAIYARAGYRELGRRPHPSRPGIVLVDMGKTVGPA